MKYPILSLVAIILLSAALSAPTAAGSIHLSFSTYLGGDRDERTWAVAVDDQDRIYVAGSTRSANFPLENPYQDSLSGSQSAFISVFSPDGSLLSSTYFGGNDEDTAYGIALHQLSPDEIEVWVTGYTSSDNFPRVEALQNGSSVPAQPDAFVSGFLFQPEAGTLDLKLSTYLGGAGWDRGRDITVDGQGDIYVVGKTESPDFPFDWIPSGQTGAQISFVTKFSCGRDPHSWDWGYSLCLTGSGDDRAWDKAWSVAVDDTGSAWVAGYTNAPVFYGTDNPSDGRNTAFIVRIAAEPDQHAWLLHSRLLGGRNFDRATGIALRRGILPGSIQAVVVGRTSSVDFPVTGLGDDILQPDYGGGIDAFVSVIDFTDPNYRLEYSTYLGGSGLDEAEGVALDSRGNIYVVGKTESSDFPIVNPIQESRRGEGRKTDAFAARLNWSGNRLIWSTFLGGEHIDRGRAIAVDSAGAAIVAGHTSSDDFPVFAAFQPEKGGGQFRSDAFVAKISDGPEPGPWMIDPGDYSGDGTSEIAVFRPDSGLWAVRGLTRVYFGTTGDIPVPADYTGDGTTEVAIFRPSSGLWAVRGLPRYYFGTRDDIPVPGDYTGDGTSGSAVFRPSSGLWAVRGLTRFYFGGAGDRPVPGPYGGGPALAAVFRPASGFWAIRNLTRIYFGTQQDRPVPGDYDESGHWAPAVFRPSTGLWAIRFLPRSYFGAPGDRPVPADYIGYGRDRLAVFRPDTGLWAIRGVTHTYFGGASDIPVSR